MHLSTSHAVDYVPGTGRQTLPSDWGKGEEDFQRSSWLNSSVAQRQGLDTATVEGLCSPSKSRTFRSGSPSHLGLRYFWEEEEVRCMGSQGNEVPGGGQ